MESFARPEIDYLEGDALASSALKSSVDQFASDVAKQLGLGPADPLEPAVKKLGGRIHKVSPFEFSEKEATIWVHGPNDFDIVIADFGYSRRNRFTIAHEIGHYVLHSNQGKKQMKANRDGTGRLEWEANWFAAGLLMPATQFKSLATKEHWPDSKLADYFGVSEPAVEIRKKALGITE